MKPSRQMTELDVEWTKSTKNRPDKNVEWIESNYDDGNGQRRLMNVDYKGLRMVVLVNKEWLLWLEMPHLWPEERWWIKKSWWCMGVS